MLMAISIRDNGKIIRLTDLARLWMPVELNMQESGSMTFNMVKEKKVGLMRRPDTLVTSIRERKMAKEDLSGKTEASMRVTSLKDTFKDKVKFRITNSVYRKILFC